jgi:glycosyltransferase involved in cell wall biosynthesis
MNNKLPIIFSTDNNTDVYRIAEQNKFGLWAGSNDLTLFNQQINKLIEKSSLRKEMGENGYKFLIENYHIDVAYNKIVKHF